MLKSYKYVVVFLFTLAIVAVYQLVEIPLFTAAGSLALVLLFDRDISWPWMSCRLSW